MNHPSAGLSATLSWTEPSPAAAFSARRARLLALLPSSWQAPVWLVAGYSRPRNFPHNRYRFRAESHFLYLVGRHLEGAVLVLSRGEWTLFAKPADASDALWTGPVPSLEELSGELGLPVRPLDELKASSDVVLIPPQDVDTAMWLLEKLDREIVGGGGDKLEADAAPLGDALIELRLRHDEAAVFQLRQAAVVTERAHRAGMAATRPGLREAVIRAAMEQPIIAAGMTTSYNSIVTVHGEVLHNEQHHHLLGARDLLLADVGAETAEGWAGDVTRTWPVSGRFSATQKAIYEVVLATEVSAIERVAPGVRYLEIHRHAGRTLLAGLGALGIVKGDPQECYEAGLAGLFFPHGVGHLLGLDVHDMEDLGDRAGYAPGRSRLPGAGDRYLRLDRDLEPGMAVTIEPGFYQIPGLTERDAAGKLADLVNWDELAKYDDVRGIRIEDDVLVTETGRDVLTRGIPKSVGDVEAAMQG
ncbi:MAG: aminopeptidase P family protein [Polyangiaceae bacterium]|nr:aminopeptidase P family protein [Myxococcales bacterium]MCB9585003.1 aminopeptidase P family protein [Polyangiaceae bacterium]MCB9607424.1 aminopeptidase P family protein [Polyangiaceae bacterium]